MLVDVGGELRCPRACIIADYINSCMHAWCSYWYGMDDSLLQTIYRSVIISKLTYASSAWSGFTSAADRQQLEAFI